MSKGCNSGKSTGSSSSKTPQGSGIWPSKVSNVPSGKGRYNAPPGKK